MKTNLFILLLICSFASAQTATETYQMRKFGIGMKTLNLFNELSQNSEVFPGNRILFMINPTNHIRIQPEIGMSSYGSFDSDLDEDLTNSTFLIGTSFVGMWQKGKTNLYGGIKYLHSSVSMEDKHVNYGTNGSMSFSKVESQVNFNTFGLLFGGEYFLGDHFSVGAEAGYQTTTGKPDENPDDLKETFNSTETNLLLRFYF